MKIVIKIKRMHGIWYYNRRVYNTWSDALQAAWSGMAQAHV